MPSAREVRPPKWEITAILFDNGEYSVISGIFEGEGSVLGERWNGREHGVGFPSVAGRPVWHVVPEFLAVPVLHGLLAELTKNPTSQPHDQIEAIRRELATRQQHAAGARAGAASGQRATGPSPRN